MILYPLNVFHVRVSQYKINKNYIIKKLVLQFFFFKGTQIKPDKNQRNHEIDTPQRGATFAKIKKYYIIQLIKINKIFKITDSDGLSSLSFENDPQNNHHVKTDKK